MTAKTSAARLASQRGILSRGNSLPKEWAIYKMVNNGCSIHRLLDLLYVCNISRNDGYRFTEL
jgi:hypothetical protein